MKRQIHGLSETAQPCADAVPDGVFLVRVDRAQYRWHPAKALLPPPSLRPRTSSNLPDGRFPDASTAPPKPCGSSDGSSVISFMTRICSAATRSTRKLSPDSAAWSRSATPPSTALPCSTSMGSRPPVSGQNCPRLPLEETGIRGGMMTYSYTQISQYLTCPRRYRHRYLDGWKEKDTRAAMLFGRAFEQALAAYFRGKTPEQRCFANGLPTRTATCSIRTDDLGPHAAARHPAARALAQDDRVRDPPAQKESQIKFTRSLRREMTSSPTLTRSENWTAHAACWSGRPLPAGIRKNRRDC